MFSVDNFYNYLHYKLHNVHIPIDMYYFPDPGNRDISSIDIFGVRPAGMPSRYPARCILYDQEPLENHYSNWNKSDLSRIFSKDSESFAKNLPIGDLISYSFSGVHTPILCHSESNSDDVAFWQKHFYATVHYFYHGFIARDWFRHWKNYNMKRDPLSSRFGLYARAASGSRSYRIELLSRLTAYKDNTYYRLQPEIADLLPTEIKRNWQFNTVAKGPESSAIIDIEDSSKFQIQLVPETLFDTKKTHLTEKVFKPMVMKQPFIIIGPPNSLQYLKNYGFKTFNKIWDESYDQETNPQKRMELIFDLLDTLYHLDDQAFNKIIEQCQSIVNYNHQHFFSQKFEDQMLSEMHTELENAVNVTQERFYTMPGGNWFYYQNKLVQDKKVLPHRTRDVNNDILKYLKKENHEKVAKQIATKFSHLL